MAEAWGPACGLVARYELGARKSFPALVAFPLALLLCCVDFSAGVAAGWMDVPLGGPEALSAEDDLESDGGAARSGAVSLLQACRRGRLLFVVCK